MRIAAVPTPTGGANQQGSLVLVQADGDVVVGSDLVTVQVQLQAVLAEGQGEIIGATGFDAVIASVDPVLFGAILHLDDEPAVRDISGHVPHLVAGAIL